jgi:DNA-binding MarR family transcriptional regulator
MGIPRILSVERRRLSPLTCNPLRFRVEGFSVLDKSATLTGAIAVMAKKTSVVNQEVYDLPDFPSRRSIPYLVQYLSRLMMADYQDRTAKTGVAPAQSYVLRELWREEPLSQVEISQRLDIGKATVGQSVKRLEHAGFIRRGRNGEDGRVSMVHLTAKGRAVRTPLGAAARTQVEDIDAVLGRADAKRLETLLEKLLEHHRSR